VAESTSVELFLSRWNPPCPSDQARAAALAWSRFGKDRHPAALNFGDCFSYALAKIAAEPLLFEGADFHHTDVIPAQ
jgi:ribonuclease VapC